MQAVARLWTLAGMAHACYNGIVTRDNCLLGSWKKAVQSDSLVTGARAAGLL